MADEKRSETPERQGDVLGISDAAPPQTEADREVAVQSKLDPQAGGRRRRADDLAEQGEERQLETGPDDPRGLHVDR